MQKIQDAYLYIVRRYLPLTVVHNRFYFFILFYYYSFVIGQIIFFYYSKIQCCPMKIKIMIPINIPLLWVDLSFIFWSLSLILSWSLFGRQHPTSSYNIYRPSLTIIIIIILNFKKKIDKSWGTIEREQGLVTNWFVASLLQPIMWQLIT